MTVKRFAIVVMLLGVGAILESCSGFSNAVADHWPHWAGGEPVGTPPRPGSPGYDEFIAHKPRDTGAAEPTGSAAPTGPAAASPGSSAPADRAVVDGGLY